MWSTLQLRGCAIHVSDAEQALWHLLLCHKISGLKFHRQHTFGDYILDFVCLENKLVIEVDGVLEGGGWEKVPFEREGK